MFFATVPVGGVFCNGGGCFLRRSWWEGMFFATAGHVFCIGRVCFFASVVFFATVTHVFCDGWRSPPPQPDGPEEVMLFATVPASVW